MPNRSCTRIMSLKERIFFIVKGDSNVYEYLRSIRSVVDEWRESLQIVVSTLSSSQALELIYSNVWVLHIHFQ